MKCPACKGDIEKGEPTFWNGYLEQYICWECFKFRNPMTEVTGIATNVKEAGE